MESDDKKPASRGLGAIFRVLGVTSSDDLASVGQKSPADSVQYGVFDRSELEAIINFDPNNPRRGGIGDPLHRKNPRLEDVMSYFELVSNKTRSKIDEIRNLKIVAPEIKAAQRVIVSSIMSPTDLQTNAVNITMDYEMPAEIKKKILDNLNHHFNDEFHLATKISEWLKIAGFEEGARAVVVLPKHEISVQAAIAKSLGLTSGIGSNENLLDDSFRKAYSMESLEKGVESLHDDDMKRSFLKLDSQLQTAFELSLESIDAEKYFKKPEKEFSVSIESNKQVKVSTPEQMAAQLKRGTYKLLSGVNGSKVTVTRDMRTLTASKDKRDDRLKDLIKDAEAQFSGFHVDENGKGVVVDNVRMFTISDDLKIGDTDLPTILEFPSDSVIPVCAPRDNKNHIGYFVLLDDNGQPISGRNTVFVNGNRQDASARLATNAAVSIYGNATLQAYKEMTGSPDMMLTQMSDVFTVAVNRLLESRLRKDGLDGLDITTHSAVGKAMFLNLLAGNQIKVVFVPEPMMIYYRFDHRDDGTGKTLLEDVEDMIALRTTLTVAKLMAAIDNATLHRTIELDVDENDNNALQAFEAARREALSKYTPAFASEVQTAAESIVNRNITFKPKSMEGTTDNLSVNIEKSTGSVGSPDDSLLEKLNNWISTGLGVPASVLNQLGENEFSRSVASTNMFFANDISSWQDYIAPFNKKFVVNYTKSNARLIKMIREALAEDKKGNRETQTKEEINKNKSDEIKDESLEQRVKDIINSLNVDLPRPSMVVKKAQYEEITAFIDAVQKLIDIIYSDDVCASDELRGNMGGIRAIILSQIVREFLPKLGVQSIAEIPTPTHIEADYTREINLMLLNLARRVKNAVDLAKGTLPGKTDVNEVSGGEPSNDGGTDWA